MKTVAIVCGGYSKEEVISLRSAEQIAQILETRFRVFTVLINRQQWVVKHHGIDMPVDKNDFSFMHNEIKVKFDVVFMAIHGTPGEDGKLQSYFEMLGIPFTTCNSFVSSLTFNKYACKVFLKDYDILTAEAILLRKGQTVSAEELEIRYGFPVFVKPNNGGSSFGVSKVKTPSELLPAIEKAFAEDTEIIIEPYIKGGEYTCGVFKSNSESIVFPPTEIVSKKEFFDFEAKYTPGMSEEITPARLPESQLAKCKELSSEIYDLLGCNGVVRVDYLLKNGKFYFMEINTVPGMSKESIIPKQTAVYGLPVIELYTKMIEDALTRA